MAACLANAWTLDFTFNNWYLIPSLTLKYAGMDAFILVKTYSDIGIQRSSVAVFYCQWE
jgi:hypothetical protein